MKKIFVYSIAGLILLVIFVLALAPARLVYPWFSERIAGLSLGQVTGSVWDARIESLHYRSNTLHNIELQLKALPLVTGTLSGALQVTDPRLNLDGALALSAQSLQLQDVTYQLQADSILDWVRLPIKGLAGQFIGSFEQLELEGQTVTAVSGQGQWQEAAIVYANSTLELGAIHYQFSHTENGQLLLEITDNPGVLDLKGTLTLNADKSYQLKVSTRKDLPPRLTTWLSRLGRADNNRIHVLWNGRLP